MRKLTLKDLLSRVDFKVSLEEVCKHVTSQYKLGDVIQVDPLFVGHDELNVHVQTNQGDYAIKFMNKRKPKEICLYCAEIIQRLSAEGLEVPEVIANPSGGLIYELPTEVGTGYLFITKYFPSKSFNESLPNQDDMKHFAIQLAKMHQLNFETQGEYDMWILRYLADEYAGKSVYLSDEDKELTKDLAEQFKAIDLSKLTKGIVHNDLHRDNARKSDDGKYCMFDFATVEHSYTIMDLATYIGLFCLFGEMTVEELNERIRMIVSEYENTGKLSDYEKSILGILIQCIWVSNILISNYLRVKEDDDTDETYKWYAVGKSNLAKYKGKVNIN